MESTELAILKGHKGDVCSVTLSSKFFLASASGKFNLYLHRRLNYTIVGRCERKRISTANWA